MAVSGNPLPKVVRKLSTSTPGFLKEIERKLAVRPGLVSGEHRQKTKICLRKIKNFLQKLSLIRFELFKVMCVCLFLCFLVQVDIWCVNANIRILHAKSHMLPAARVRKSKIWPKYTLVDRQTIQLVFEQYYTGLRRLKNTSVEKYCGSEIWFNQQFA